MQSEIEGHRKPAERAAGIALVATLVVVSVKWLAAAKTGSISVLAEGLQSSVDILMSMLAIVTLRYAAKPPDDEHPYGHGKAELLISALQMLLIFASAAVVLWLAYKRLLHPEPIEWDWGAAAMLYTAASNTTLSIYLRRVAARARSATLESESLHLRTDTIASLGVLLGLVLYHFTNWPQIDPAVAGIFTLFAIGLAALQLRRVMHPLMDGAIPAAERQTLEQILDGHPEVRGYHNLRTRWSGNNKMVELHVMLDDHLSFILAHSIAEHIENDLREALGGAEVNIHYEPFEAELEHRALEH